MAGAGRDVLITNEVPKPRVNYGWFSQEQAAHGTVVYTVPGEDYLVECSEVMNFGVSAWPDAVAVGRVGTHVSDVPTDAVVRKAGTVDVSTGWFSRKQGTRFGISLCERFDRPGRVVCSEQRMSGVCKWPDAVACGYVGSIISTSRTFRALYLGDPLFLTLS